MAVLLDSTLGAAVERADEHDACGVSAGHPPTTGVQLIGQLFVRDLPVSPSALDRCDNTPGAWADGWVRAVRVGLEAALLDAEAFGQWLTAYGPRVNVDAPCPPLLRDRVLADGLWGLTDEELMQLALSPGWVVDLSTALGNAEGGECWVAAADRYLGWMYGAMPPAKPLVAALRGNASLDAVTPIVATEIRRMLDLLGDVPGLAYGHLVRLADDHLVQPYSLPRAGRLLFARAACAAVRELIRATAAPLAGNPQADAPVRAQATGASGPRTPAYRELVEDPLRIGDGARAGREVLALLSRCDRMKNRRAAECFELYWLAGYPPERVADLGLRDGVRLVRWARNLLAPPNPAARPGSAAGETQARGEAGETEPASLDRRYTTTYEGACL